MADARFCTSETDKSKIRAYLGANTITYATPDVADSDQQKTARYSEAAVRYIKKKLAIADTVEGFDGLISVCADGRQPSGGGGAAERAIFVDPTSRGDEPGADQPGDTLKSLVLHELIHVSHISLSQCGNRGVNYLPKWFSEGSAVFLAGQDYYYVDDIPNIRRAGNGENPYTWIANGYPNFSLYPAYRLAVEALVKESGKTEDDLWAFTKSYFAANPCTSGDTIFNPAISAAFGNLLSDTNYLNKFWTDTLNKYAIKP